MTADGRHSAAITLHFQLNRSRKVLFGSVAVDDQQIVVYCVHCDRRTHSLRACTPQLARTVVQDAGVCSSQGILGKPAPRSFVVCRSAAACESEQVEHRGPGPAGRHQSGCLMVTQARVSGPLSQPLFGQIASSLMLYYATNRTL